jgi:competence protein ComEC
MKFRRTSVMTVGLLAFLGGLGLSRTGWFVSNELIISCGLLLLVSITRLRWLALLSVILFGLCLGWWRGQSYLALLEPMRQLDDKRVTAFVQADSDATYNDKGQLSFDASHLLLESTLQEVPGRLKIAGFGTPAVFRGDTVKISGRFYATRGSRQLGMSFANLEVVGSNSSWVDTIRRRFAAGLMSAVPEPEASFGLGLLIGQRSTLPTEITTQLAAVGLTHIIAVSGYNLTIIMRGVRRLLDKRSKYQATLISLLLIGIFLLMTGMSASIVRAAIVSGLSILAWYYGRTFKPLLLLSLAAAITAGWNPLYIWSDIGWYLSFLAFFGVLILSPLLNQRFFGKREPAALLALMSESFCALIMTMPLIMYIFKQISLVALPANLLIVPLVPIAMLAALIAGLAGMLVPVIAGLFSWPATLLMTAMLDIAQLISKIPHALAQRGVTLAGMLLWYGCLTFITFILWRVVNQKHAKITEINTEQ